MKRLLLMMLAAITITGVVTTYVLQDVGKVRISISGYSFETTLRIAGGCQDWFCTRDYKARAESYLVYRISYQNPH